MKELFFLTFRAWRDASTKEAQTLPLTAKSQVLEHDRDRRIVVLCVCQAHLPQWEADGAVLVLRDGFVRRAEWAKAQK